MIIGRRPCSPSAIMPHAGVSSPSHSKTKCTSINFYADRLFAWFVLNKYDTVTSNIKYHLRSIATSFVNQTALFNIVATISRDITTLHAMTSLFGICSMVAPLLTCLAHLPLYHWLDGYWHTMFNTKMYILYDMRMPSEHIFTEPCQ